MSYGYPYRGQPSVVYGVPFTLGQEQGLYSAMTPVGFGSVDGTDADPGAMHAMDGTITDDPIGAPGSGADRLRLDVDGDLAAGGRGSPLSETTRRPALPPG